MIKLLSWIFLILTVSFQTSHSQILKGKITNQNGEPIQYATVYIQELKQGTTANTKGDYELRLPAGKYMVIYQSLGFEPIFADITMAEKPIVKNITLKYKRELFNNWNGIDYYDNECIKENLILNPLDRSYPTIDHKTSVLYGFLNDIPPEVIGDISNLCITKKHINSSKKEKCSI